MGRTCSLRTVLVITAAVLFVSGPASAFKVDLAYVLGIGTTLLVQAVGAQRPV